MLVVGIDEAGYGPILGPLVISAAVFKTSPDLAGVSMWDLLTDSVTVKPSQKTSKLIVADSKKVYSGKGRITQLERSALGAVWSVSQKYPDKLESLLKDISLVPDPHLHHPWYCHSNPVLPVQADSQELRIAVKLFKRELAELNCSLADIISVPLTEGNFNRLYKQMRNKSAVVTGQIFMIIDRIIKNCDDEKIVIHVDRQGGKSRYIDDLLRNFSSESKIEIIEENDQNSAYSFGYSGKNVRINFTAKADTTRFSVALASIVSKYIREIFMKQFNTYWSDLYPEITETAGYHTDGIRFLNDLCSCAEKGRIPVDDMVRHDQAASWKQKRHIGN